MTDTAGALSPNDYISAGAAARRLGYKPNTLAKWRSQGYGPCFRKDRRKISYRVGTLDEWATANDGFANTAQVTFARQLPPSHPSETPRSGGTAGAQRTQPQVH
jgi:hypothetical protein